MALSSARAHRPGLPAGSFWSRARSRGARDRAPRGRAQCALAALVGGSRPGNTRWVIASPGLAQCREAHRLSTRRPVAPRQTPPSRTARPPPSRAATRAHRHSRSVSPAGAHASLAPPPRSPTGRSLAAPPVPRARGGGRARAPRPGEAVPAAAAAARTSSLSLVRTSAPRGRRSRAGSRATSHSGSARLGCRAPGPASRLPIVLSCIRVNPARAAAGRAGAPAPRTSASCPGCRRR